MRLVLDTSILIAAFRSSTGASRQLLRMVPQRRFRVITSSALYLEDEAVLTRPEQISIHGISPRDIARFLMDTAYFTDQVRVYFSYRPQLIDPSEWMS